MSYVPCMSRLGWAEERETREFSVQDDGNPALDDGSTCPNVQHQLIVEQFACTAHKRLLQHANPPLTP